jgi:hypothetical protein
MPDPRKSVGVRMPNNHRASHTGCDMSDMMNQRELTGFCGLYCGDCIRYQCRASELAGELLGEIEKTHFREYAGVKRIHKTEFKHFDPFVRFLKALSEINCQVPCGAGGDGCGGSCQIIACVKTRQLQGCWECPEHEHCGKLDFLTPFHGDGPRRNLRKIREHGINNWTAYRAKCYPWI